MNGLNQFQDFAEQDKVKEKYAQTLWILAQVHDRMGDARVSAEYRAGTLELQLGMGEPVPALAY